jgi:hypothetical protein
VRSHWRRGSGAVGFDDEPAGSPVRPLPLAVALTVVGCASGPTRHVEQVESLRVSAVVVEPLRTSGGATSEEVGALSARVALRTVTATSGRALIWGPSEVHPLHPERTDWTATDALLQLQASAVPPAEVLLLRARLDRATAEGRQEVAPLHGAVAQGASAETTYRARVELIHPSSGRMVVETTAEARVDPFRVDEPGVGPLLDRVVDDALAAIEPRWARPLRPPLDAWRLLAAGADESGLEGEVQRMARLRLANPGLGEEEAARLLRRPAGVYVRAALLEVRLRAGDVVVRTDGAPTALEPLERLRVLNRDTRLEVQADDGSTRRVRWP